MSDDSDLKLREPPAWKWIEEPPMRLLEMAARLYRRRGRPVFAMISFDLIEPAPGERPVPMHILSASKYNIETGERVQCTDDEVAEVLADFDMTGAREGEGQGVRLFFHPARQP